MKRFALSVLWLCLFLCARVLPGLDQADPGLGRDSLLKLQKEGWKIVQDGVLRRELKTDRIETFVFSEAGFSWKLRDLQVQLQVLRREFQAHPTPDLQRAIASHGKLIASTLTMIERARTADASRESTVVKIGCTHTFAYSANASYKTDRQGTWADAVAAFNVSAGCNSSGEVYAYAFAKDRGEWGALDRNRDGRSQERLKRHGQRGRQPRRRGPLRVLRLRERDDRQPEPHFVQHRANE